MIAKSKNYLVTYVVTLFKIFYMTVYTSTTTAKHVISFIRMAKVHFLFKVIVFQEANIHRKIISSYLGNGT